ncbi:MAG TPA: phage protease [Verrucomicrobiae bacterium]
MKKFILLVAAPLSAMLARFTAPCFANEAEEADVITAANEINSTTPERIMLSPYGDFKNAQGMQRFQRADADNIVKDFNSLLNTPARRSGLPVYIGHPDHPAFKDTYKDKTSYARVKSLEATEEGLFANVKWSKRGKDLIEDEAFSSPSVNWRMRYDAGASVWRPFSLKSVGLVNEPNLPVPTITAANEKSDIMERALLIAALKLKADATDKDILTAIDGQQKENTRLAANEATLETERQSKTALEQNFANERKERVALMIAAGLEQKKITPAEKTQWEKDFANEFDSTLTKWNALKPKVSSSFKSDGLGKRSAQESERATQIQEFVNERMDKHKEDYHTAYKAVKRARKDLFPETNGTTGS